MRTRYLETQDEKDIPYFKWYIMTSIQEEGIANLKRQPIYGDKIKDEQTPYPVGKYLVINLLGMHSDQQGT